MPSAMELAADHPALKQAVQRSRALLHKRALVAAAAGVVPLPGLDWAVDAALLARLIPRISGEFGLLPDQIDRLAPSQRERVQKAVAMIGSVLIGRFITRDLLLRAAQAIGLRLSAGQAARFVPLAGQAVSAAIGYTTLRYLGEQHIKDCVRVALAAQMRLPGPESSGPAFTAGTP
ncbi:hypothetical protein [Ramlibacter sp. 2FC]|uniref:hypothetical protein n=1 Tax=Ramlibacter sp. 2FC TaxID=2502188 RepID=UPI0010F7D9BF|nr:hypothetical protein [Ramlibacter sp. 2FC]